MSNHVHRAELYSVNHVLLRHISLREAEDMIEAGDAVRISRRKAPVVMIRLRAGRKAETTRNETSISLAEIQANAGLYGGRRRARSRRRIGNFVDHAMHKVRQWPIPERRTYAVTICAGQVIRPVQRQQS